MGQTGKNNAYYSLGRVVKDFSHCQGTDPTSDTKYCFIASQIWKAALGLFPPTPCMLVYPSDISGVSSSPDCHAQLSSFK